MPSSFLTSPSSSASSHLSYLIPARPPPPLAMGQGYGASGISLPTGGVEDAAVAPPRQGARNAGAGHPPLPRPPPRQCPRCQSANTKFCYYNNYSTAQPRHFCRTCRRYWTHGGTLRDVPVGGASRRSGGGKRRRVEPSSASPPPTEAAAAPPGLAAEDACLPGLSAFPFLSDGSFLPQFDFDLGAAPAAFSSWQSVVPSFYDGLAPWDDGTVAAAAWGDIAGGLDLSWTPPGN